jgi:PD-(D/E)XK nuclease superfamily
MAAKREVGSKRWYTVPNGQEYPSVTTILQVIGKPALINWAAKVEREMVIEASSQLYLDCPLTPKMSAASWKMSLTKRLGTLKASQKELTKAGEIGSQAHALIEWNLKASLMQEPGPSPHVTDKATWAFMAWEDWKKSVNLKPIFVEQMVFSETHGYAGTMDLLAEVNGVLTVLDWKTGKAIYPESYLQNAAYRYALREMGHGDAVQGIIVRLPKLESDPAFEVKTCPPEKDCMEVFLNAKRLWEWNQKNDTYKPPPEQNIEEKLKESLANA